MTGIFFRPDKTQVIKAKVKGDKKLLMKDAVETESCLKIFKDCLANAEGNRVAELFQELKTKFKLGSEDVYLVMPDEMFEMTDAANITSDAELKQFVENSTGLDFSEVYVSIAIEATPGQYKKKTVYVMRKSLVDEIAKAADRLNIQVVSIEAASMAMVRGLGDWKREKILLPVTGNSADIISYSPLGGIFKLETNLTEQKFVEQPEKAERELKSAIKKRDIAAEYTYTSINDRVPINVLSSDKIKIDLEDRRGGEIKFQSCVEFEKPLKASEWIAVTGTLMQVYKEGDEIFSDSPPFLKIGSGNILPEEKQVGAKIKQWQQMLKKFLNSAAVVMFGILAILGGVILYFSRIQITPDLQSAYDDAQKTDVELSREIGIIELAKKEDEKPIEAFATLMQYRTEDLYLTNFAIGGNDASVNWVKFTAVSEDPIKFQDLLSRLREEKKFTNCSLAEISSDTGDYKKANFSLGKGREENE